jgi:hypothetical protein
MTIIDELKLCPFCGSKPKIKLGKKGHCQLHGDPYQGVVIYCDNHECKIKCGVEAGDIYNGGETKAREEVKKIWNTRNEKI